MTAGVLVALASIGGMVDPPEPSEPGWDPWGVAFVVTSLAFAIRAALLSVRATATELIVRNLLSTRRIDRTAVVTVTIANYDGFMVWDTRRGTSWFSVPSIKLRDGRLQKAFGLLGTTRGSEHRAAQLRAAIGAPDPRPPQHRTPKTTA
jgi:hypothetical protein